MSDQRTHAVTFQPMTTQNAKRLGAALAEIDPWAYYGYTPEALTTYLAADEQDAPRWQILVDDVVAGAIVIRWNWLRGPYLQFLGILPAFQNSGVGKATLAWLEADARSHRVQNIWVVASEFNTTALAFYERFGFVRIATLDGLVSEGTAECLFRKRLTAQ